MVSVKGTASKLEKEILGGIIEPNCPNIEFKNITFDCKSIKDAAGHIFINQTYWNVVPVRHGHWIHVDYRKTICSVCEVDESDFIYGTEDWYGCGESKFCPNCGAKMDSE